MHRSLVTLCNYTSNNLVSAVHAFYNNWLCMQWCLRVSRPPDIYCMRSTIFRAIFHHWAMKGKQQLSLLVLKMQCLYDAHALCYMQCTHSTKSTEIASSRLSSLVVFTYCPFALQPSMCIESVAMSYAVNYECVNHYTLPHLPFVHYLESGLTRSSVGSGHAVPPLQHVE